MSELVCIAFSECDTADKVLSELQAMQKEYLIELEDAALVTRDMDGKVHVKQTVDLTRVGATHGGAFGALWGTLIGVLFMNPLAGLLAGGLGGAGLGALSGALSDYGIDDDFIKSLGSSIEPNCSALFLLVRKANAEKILPRLSQYRGTVLKTSLTHEQEDALRDALSGALAVH